MDIESFVSKTLKQLGAGVANAKGTDGISLAPVPYTEESTNRAGDRLVDQHGNGAIIVFVEFDLSVVVRSRVEGGAEAKVEVLSLLDFGGAKLEGSVDHTRVQRIKFEVPVSFPVT